MGEWSKTIGERGEQIGQALLERLGWGDNQQGVKIACSKNKEHALADAPKRETHGIDFLYSYQSPFCDELCDNLIVSSKYSSVAYPPKSVSSFKGFYKDLVQNNVVL